jgi:selenocysteine lyase/cysteine desulfurase
VAFTVEGRPGGDVTAALRAKRIVQRATGLKFSGVRIAPAFFNTDAEVEAVIGAVREIAK